MCSRFIQLLCEKLASEYITYLENESQLFWNAEKEVINGIYLTGDRNKQLDMATIVRACIENLSKTPSLETLNTIKNHHFFSRHFWLNPEFYSEVPVDVYYSAHQDYAEPQKVIDVVRLSKGFQVKLANGDKVYLHTNTEHDFGIYNPNGVLGIRQSDLAQFDSQAHWNMSFSEELANEYQLERAISAPYLRTVP